MTSLHGEHVVSGSHLHFLHLKYAVDSWALMNGSGDMWTSSTRPESGA